MQILADGPPQAIDELLAAQEELASAEECAQRQVVMEEDLCCYITFLRPDEAVLGLGLHVHPQTAAQHKMHLSCDLDLVCDYVDVDAFNKGVSLSATSEDAHLPSIVSSSRKQLNGWFPLYINAHHWARARPYVASAFKVLAGRKPQSQLRASDILDVCCSLLTCVVVGFLKDQDSNVNNATFGRVQASERSVQMYADVHRLFLQMAREYPEVGQLATRRLRLFIQDPANRTRKNTPRLGDLVHCLLVSAEISWRDLAPSLIPEALRRHVVRQETRGLMFDSKSCCGSVDRLIDSWDFFAPQAGAVVCFCALFCQCVGRSRGKLLEQVESGYDRCWGRLSSTIVKDIICACSSLRSHNSIRSYFPLLLPDCEFQSFHEFHRCSEKCMTSDVTNTIGEFILWAERYGRSWHAIPSKMWPKVKGARTLLRQWSEALSSGQCAWDVDWETAQNRQYSNPYRQALQQTELQSEHQLFQLQQYMYWLQRQPVYVEQPDISQPNFHMYQDFEISVH